MVEVLEGLIHSTLINFSPTTRKAITLNNFSSLSNSVSLSLYWLWDSRMEKNVLLLDRTNIFPQIVVEFTL